MLIAERCAQGETAEKGETNFKIWLRKNEKIFQLFDKIVCLKEIKSNL